MIKPIKNKEKTPHTDIRLRFLSFFNRINPLHRIQKLRTQFLIVLLFAGILGILLFQFSWKHQPQAWHILKNLPGLSADKDVLIKNLQEAAPNYDMPQSEDDTEGIEKLAPFFALTDYYTSIYIYADSDGLFRASSDAELLKTKTWNIFSSMVFQITYIGYSSNNDILEEQFSFPVEFRNGSATIYVSLFHNSLITIPYFIFSLGVSITLFLLIVMLFIRRKIRHVLKLKDEILLMSGGDLSHPVPVLGNDEIGIVSQELDKLRLALNENMQQETESRKANQDLITAMSHDLRTPLTILNGYLEVLKLKKKPNMQEEYLNRCLAKTNDIRQMTDRMFEYALVFENTETITLAELPLSWIQQRLAEHIDFLRLAGFTVKEFICESSGVIPGDETILKRIFQNLFSNILKYGDKKNAVQVQCLTEHNQLKITLVNTIKQDLSGIESNHIGLKSARKMVELHNGTLFVSKEGGIYIVEILLPEYAA